MTPPDLSVILVTPHRFAPLRRTVRHLREQSVVGRIELILLGPEDDSFDDLDPAEVTPFAGIRTLAVGPVETVERAYPRGIRIARGSVVALLENHVYPDPDWAESILEAHEGPWAAVGSVHRNALPANPVSWTEHLLTYGMHDEATPGGEVSAIARNNPTFKRSLFDDFGDELGDVLSRDGGFQAELRRRGHRFFRQQHAQLEHLSPSLLRGSFFRFHSARAWAATRARTGGWSSSRRLGYTLASPIFPLLRLRALWPVLRHGLRGLRLPRVLPMLGLGLLIDAAGQACGYVLGPGSSVEKIAGSDLDRLPWARDGFRERFET